MLVEVSMKTIATLALIALVGCGGEESDDQWAHPNATPEDYIDQATLDLAENEAQEICLISTMLADARLEECGRDNLPEFDLMNGIESCQQQQLPVRDGDRTLQSCHDFWAKAHCENLTGRVGDSRAETCYMWHELERNP